MQCASLIGMPGSGKSTIGRILADILNFAFLDTDHVMEALYARRLQAVTEELDTETFRDVEADVICGIRAEDCVIATGGSAIYRHRAIDHLKRLGPLVLLNPPFAVIEERVGLKPDRGISFGAGQTLADIYRERKHMYLAAADIVCDTGDLSPEECAKWIASRIASQ